jgi:hypothetical protein
MGRGRTCRKRDELRFKMGERRGEMLRRFFLLFVRVSACESFWILRENRAGIEDIEKESVSAVEG